MQLHQLTQGSAEWHAHRASFFNASDAPAMMGFSPYKTRTQLMHEMATGLTADVDAGTQRLFDAGHRAEALTRPLAEEIIGEELYPVVGTDGKLSASFDGLTLMNDIAFEHKSLNDELRSVITDEACGALLPLHYRVQMEQQLLVSGAEKCLFMATKWSGDTLAEQRHTWYYADEVLRAQIVAGWAQFESDLATYVPAEVVAPVTASAQESLPAVSVRMSGELVVASNLPDFGAALHAFVDRIPAKPSTDQEFADAEAACKALKRAEEALDAAETNALAQMSDVESMRRMVADFKNIARTARLASEKSVAARKEQIKTEIVFEGKNALSEHIAALNTRLGKPYMPAIAADFAGAIKGKKTVQSLRDAMSTELARAKIEASAIADKIDANLKTLRELASEHAFLFADAATIVQKAPDDLAALVKNRISEHQAAEAKRLEAERDRIRAEEAAKLERQRSEEAARIQHQQEAEERQRQQYIRDEEAKRAIEAMEHSRQLAAAAQDTQAQAPQQVLKAEPETADAGLVSASVSPIRPADDRMINLGAINTRLGFTVSAVLLSDLGFDPAMDKRACLYRESDFPAICRGISAHVLAVAVEKRLEAA